MVYGAHKVCAACRRLLSVSHLVDTEKQLFSFFTCCCGSISSPSAFCCLSSPPAAEVQAIASLIEKQAQIVVKHKKVSEETKKGKEALLAQYANVTDDEQYPFPLLP